MSEQQQGKSQRSRTRALRLKLWWLVALSLLLLALYVIVVRQLMVFVPELREPLQELLSERLEMPVAIDGLSGHVDGLSPVFVLSGVRLDADQDSPPLRIGEVSLTLDVLPSLLHRGLRLRQLQVSGVNLHLVREEGGPVRLKGRDLPADTASAGLPLRDILEPVYRYRRLVLDDVSAIIDLPGMPRLETRDLQLALVNSGARHRLALRFSLLDKPLVLDARLDMRGDAYSLEQINGRGYLSLRGEGLEYWLPEQLELPLRPLKASGEVSLWGRLRAGRIQQAHVSLAANDLLLGDGGAAEPEAGSEWTLADLNTRARLDRLGDVFLLSVDGLQAQTDTGLLQLGPLVGQWQKVDDRLRWRVGADDIDLTALREQLQAWPFPMQDTFVRISEQLDSREPGGRLGRVYLAGEGRDISQLAARFENTSLAALGPQPGFRRLSGWFQGTPEQGVLVLDSPSLELQLAELFSRPLEASIAGALRWQQHNGGYLLDSGRLVLSNPDAHGEALLSLIAAPGEVPEMRLRGMLADGLVANAARYIPVERFEPGLKDWLNNAFLDGHLELARFLYEGPVIIDPSRQQDRTFQMSYDVRDTRLHFQDGWPALEEVQGQVLMHGRDIKGRDLQARLLDSRLRNASFDIPEPPWEQPPYLYVSGQLGATVADLGQVLQQTPLRDAISDEFAQWQFRDGSLDGHLLFGLPLGESSRETQVLATSRITGANLYAPHRRLDVSQISGAARFSLAEGLSSQALTAELLGYPVRGQISSDGAGTRLDMQGDMSITSLASWLDWGWLQAAQGEFPWQGSLSLPRGAGPSRLMVETGLSGVTLDAPAPLGKQADDRAALQLVMEMADDDQALRFSYRDQLTGNLQLEQGALKRGRVSIGQPVADMDMYGAGGSEQQDGLLVDGRLDHLDLPRWLDFFAERDDKLPDANALDIRVVLDAQQLELWNLSASRARFGATSSLAGWQITLDSDEVRAALSLPLGYQPRGNLPMQLEISRLHVPLDDDAERDGGLFDPLIVPVADVQISDMQIGGVDYGRWQGLLRPLEQGVRMEALSGDWRQASINGRLDWTASENGQQSHFVGDVRSRDLAATLKAWGIPPFIESSDARSSYDVIWSGSPLDFDYLALQGSGSLDIRDGLLPGSDRRTSALRLLGVVNIGNINRRLRLDFSDLWQRGLVVDRLRGNLTINDSLVDTSNLRIRSPAAEFRINGRIDIAEQRLDHEMEMTLPLSSNLYAGCLAGPAACAGIYVVERLWGDRIEKMTTASYRVSGNWDDPKVEEISR